MAELTEQIGQANKFITTSLSANQRGELTPEQIPGLYSRLIGPLVLTFLPVVLFIVLIWRSGYIDGFSISEPLLIILQQMTPGSKGFLGVMLVLGIWGLVMLILLLMDMTGGRVEMIEGAGYRKMTTSTDDDGSKTTRMYFMVGGMKFQVQQQGFLVFEDARQYRAYFTPRRKILVNIEVIE